jgi:hypothetical protein
MYCMDCEGKGLHRTAVALCHSCSAALCLEHAEVLPKRLEMSVPVYNTVELPIAARLVLCSTCRRAIEQPHLLKTA